MAGFVKVTAKWGTMRLPRSRSLEDGVLSLGGLSPLMTWLYASPSPSLVSRKSLDWTIAHLWGPSSSRESVGAAGYVLLVSCSTLTSRKRGALPKTTVFARCPRSSARPVSEPPTHLPPGPGVWGISSQEPEGFYEPTSLFRCPPPFSSIHSLKNSPPSPAPSPSPGQERLVKGTVLSGGVPEAGIPRCGRGLGRRLAGGEWGGGGELGTLSSPLPIMCV